jgi:multiple antibiotic resistance protein
MDVSVRELVLVFTSILFIVDPLIVIPSFLAMTQQDSIEMKRTHARRGAWTVAITLGMFAAAGGIIFKMFGITLGAFKIAGGILMGLNALDMVQARRSPQRESPAETAEGMEKSDIGVMPLGVPMLAGPGAISTVMVHSAGANTAIFTATLYLSIALTAYLSYLTLASATRVEHRLGQTGMRILTRLMGLVLCAIAVQFVVDGVRLTGLLGQP